MGDNFFLVLVEVDLCCCCCCHSIGALARRRRWIGYILSQALSNGSFDGGGGGCGGTCFKAFKLCLKALRSCHDDSSR